MNRTTLCSQIRMSVRILSCATVTSALVVSLNMMTVAPASAAIYKCISGTGAVTYSGRKCPEQDTTARIIADSGIGSARTRPTPAAASPVVPTPIDTERRQREAELDPESVSQAPAFID